MILTKKYEFSYINYRDIMLLLARCSVLLMLYGIAASMAIASIGTVLTLIFWILSFDWLRPWPRLLKLPAFWPLILIPLLIVVGSINSVAPLEYAYRYFGVYSRFLIMLIIIAVIDDKKWQRICWISFLIGVAVTLISTYLSVFFILPWSKSQELGLGVNHSIFYDYIAQGIMTSFFAVVSLTLTITENSIKNKIIWLLILIISIFSITHLLIGRTGQIVCAAALFVVINLALPRKKAFYFSSILIAFISILIWTSPVISERFRLLVYEIYLYQQGVEMTSIGARLSMWKASLLLFWDQPLFGHGTGSYRFLTESIFIDSVMCKISCVHPHNQFLFFGVEHGIVGVFLYGWLLLAIFRIANAVDLRNKLILYGLLAIISIDSFINSPFWISSERNFYITILALCMTSFYLNRKSSIDNE
jgi:O-antigen ligase